MHQAARQLFNPHRAQSGSVQRILSAMLRPGLVHSAEIFRRSTADRILNVLMRIEPCLTKLSAVRSATGMRDAVLRVDVQRKSGNERTICWIAGVESLSHLQASQSRPAVPGQHTDINR